MSQGKFEDLSGQKFGKLTVLYRAADYIQPSGQHKRMWHCKCDCGVECNIRANDLKSGNTQSCGCFQQYSRGKTQFEDLTGKRYGKLTVMHRAPNHITPSGQNQRVWHCKCDCGKELDIYAMLLKNGKQDCGCSALEKRQKRNEEKEKQALEKILKKKAQEEKRQKQLEEKAQRAIEIARKKKAQEEKRQKQLEEKAQRTIEITRKKQAQVEKCQQEEERRRQRKEEIEKQELAKKQSKTIRKKKTISITDYPELLNDWDYELNGFLSPDEVSKNTIVWWKCPTGGHSYDMRVGSRVGKQKCGCPYCCIPAKRVLKGFNDLSTKYPDIAKEWHPTKNGDLKPDEVLCGSGRKVWWLGKCGHSFECAIVNRTHQGANCYYCSNRKVLAGFNDLATTNPEIIKEWDFEKNTVLPTEISVGSHYKAWWKCPFGHSYPAFPYNRCGKMHSGCSICDKENHTSFPEQALYYYVKKYFPDAINSDTDVVGLELDVYIPSLKIAIEYDGRTWHKNNKHELKKNQVCKDNNILLIRIREEGLELYDDCYCLVRNDTRKNDSLSKVIKEALYDIDKIIDTDVDVERDAGVIYSSYITTRKTRSLQYLYPEIAAEWHPIKNGELTAEMVAPMTNKKVWWLGKCGHEWPMEVARRVGAKCGCYYCSGKRVLKGFNDLQSKFPQLLKDWNYEKNQKIGLFPDEVTVGSDKKAWWKCSVCGYEWQREIGVVTNAAKCNNRNGCRICANEYSAEAKFKPVKCLETNTIYKSLKEAEQLTGVSRHCICNCCKGTQKTAGKLHWEYVNGS